MHYNCWWGIFRFDWPAFSPKQYFSLALEERKFPRVKRFCEIDYPRKELCAAPALRARRPTSGRAPAPNSRPPWPLGPRCTRDVTLRLLPMLATLRTSLYALCERFQLPYRQTRIRNALAPQLPEPGALAAAFGRHLALLRLRHRRGRRGGPPRHDGLPADRQVPLRHREPLPPAQPGQGPLDEPGPRVAPAADRPGPAGPPVVGPLGRRTGRADGPALAAGNDSRTVAPAARRPSDPGPPRPRSARHSHALRRVPQGKRKLRSTAKA